MQLASEVTTLPVVASRKGRAMETDRVVIFDTTLRDAEQTPGASLTVPDKLEIAHQLARLERGRDRSRIPDLFR